MPFLRSEETQVRRNKIAELILQGVPQFKIAEQLNVSTSVVSQDFKKIRKDWLMGQRKSYDDYINQELAKLDFIEREAFDAWQQSKQEFTEVRKKGKPEESKKDPVNNLPSKLKVVPNEITQISKRKEPNPVYLSIILQVSKRRAELLGYEGMTRTDDTVVVHVNA